MKKKEQQLLKKEREIQKELDKIEKEKDKKREAKRKASLKKEKKQFEQYKGLCFQSSIGYGHFKSIIEDVVREIREWEIYARITDLKINSKWSNSGYVYGDYIIKDRSQFIYATNCDFRIAFKELKTAINLFKKHQDFIKHSMEKDVKKLMNDMEKYLSSHRMKRVLEETKPFRKIITPEEFNDMLDKAYKKIIPKKKIDIEKHQPFNSNFMWLPYVETIREGFFSYKTIEKQFCNDQIFKLKEDAMDCAEKLASKINATEKYPNIIKTYGEAYLLRIGNKK